MSGTGSDTGAVEIVQIAPRKRWTSAQKLRMVEESIQLTVSRVVRANGLSPALLYNGVSLE